MNKDFNNISIERFRQSIQIDTISYTEREKIDYSKFDNYIKFIKSAYSLVFNRLENMMIDKYNFFLKWEGEDKNLKPILLMAHYDVVPVEAEDWEIPPFSAEIKDGYIWGRGTLDDKLSMIGILEAVEALLKEGFKPKRTVYLAFGHDEEIGGEKGAKLIRDYCKDNGICFEYVIDEGSIIADGVFPGIDKPIALIGVTEKGHVDFKIEVKGKGGHASMPPPSTAAGRLCKIVSQIEKNRSKPHLTNALKVFLKELGENTKGLNRFIFKNLWLTKGLIFNFFAKNPVTDALIRTTRAVTMLEGSNKENVLPKSAKAVINVRILYPETIKSVMKELQSLINSFKNPEEEINLTIVDEKSAADPVSESDIYSKGYILIKNIVKELYDDVITVPFIVVGATDSRYFSEIAENIYRFLPIVLKKEDIDSIHNKNEKISIKNFLNLIEFYKRIITENVYKNG